MNAPTPNWDYVANSTYAARQAVRQSGTYEAVHVPSLDVYHAADGQPVRVTVAEFDVFPTPPRRGLAWRLVREEATDAQTD